MDVPLLETVSKWAELSRSLKPTPVCRHYEIRAPLSGIVVEKHANPGELASGQPLLTIANYDNIWVDLAVFPGDSHQVRTGMSVTIRMDDRVAESAHSIYQS